MVGLMYHACSNLPSSRNINEIYAQATSGRVKQATLLVIILFLKSHDSPYNSTLKCMFLYVCVCVLVIPTVVGMSHVRNTNVFVYKLAVKCN